MLSVAEPELGAGAAADFFAGQSQEPEPGAGAALFKAAPAASFRQAKKKSIVLVSNMTSVAEPEPVLFGRSRFEEPAPAPP